MKSLLLLAALGPGSLLAQVQGIPQSKGVCNLTGSQTSGYVLTASDSNSACIWQTVGGASVDNNTVKNAWFLTDSGTANAVTGTTTTTFPGSYSPGQAVIFISNATNTGASTITVTGLGAKNLTKGGSTALAAGNKVAGVPYLAVYDGTQFQLAHPTIVAADVPTLNQNTTGTAANVTGIVAEATGGTGANNTPGAAGHVLRSNGSHYVDSAIQAGDVPTLNQSTSGNAATATALAANPTNCSAGNAPAGVDASGNAENCFHVPQLFFGTAAPGSVSGNLPGDLFSDSTNHNLYWCNAASGTTAPACTSVSTGGWMLSNGTGGGGSLTIDNDGTAVGSPRAILNFVAGTGILKTISDDGTKINVQQSIDPSSIVSPATLQGGGPFTLTETSSSSSTYTFTMSPTLGANPTGLPLWTWKVGTTASGGAITGNVDTLGAKSIVEPDGTNPTVAHLTAGQKVLLTYDSALGKLVIVGGEAPASGTGVTNVATTSPITGGPITTTGTIGCATCVTGSPTNHGVAIGGTAQALTYAAADATTTHALFATAGDPAFRAIAVGDIPTLNQNTTGTASNVTGIVAEATGGTGANNTPGAAGHILRSNGTHYVDSAIQAGDIPTLNQSTSGNAGTATALAANPTNCSAGNAPAGVDASGNAENCFHVPQLFFGTAAPGSVSGNLPGDLFSDSTNHNLYWCNAASGTTAPACTSVTTGGWTLANAGGGGGVSSLTGDGTLISNSGSTGAVTLSLGTAGAHKVWMNNTGSTAAPGYQSLGAADLPTALANQTSINNVNVPSSGTSGGVECFTSTSGLASSSLLNTNQIVIGGGAGACPTSSVDWTIVSHTLTAGSSAILDLSAGTTSDLVLSGSFSTGIVHVATTTGAITSSKVNLTGAADVTGALPFLSGGTGITLMTSGGILYAPSSTSLGTSGVMGAGQFMLGGGAGTTPTSSNISGDCTTSGSAAITCTQASLATGSTGTITSGKLACITSSNTMGNCTGLPSNNVLGVFISSTKYVTFGIVSVALDNTQNVTAGDILCGSSTGAAQAHDNGTTPCTNGNWVGIVTTTASSVSSATASLRLQ